MIQLFLQGGPLFMIPLFVASVGVITIGIERVIKYRRAEVDPEGFRAALQEELSQGGIAQARDYAESIPGPLARVWADGLAHTSLPVPLLRERLEGTAAREVARLEKHLSHLEVVAQVAPLVGILGTVWGMVTAFGGVAGGLAAGVGVDGERLTGGIAQALVTTGAGLAVAIPATILHHYLRGRVDRFVEDLEQVLREITVTVASSSSRTSSQRRPRQATAVR